MKGQIISARALSKSTAVYVGLSSQIRQNLAEWALPLNISPAIRRGWSVDCMNCHDSPPDGDFQSAYYECGTCSSPFRGLFGEDEPMYCLNEACHDCGLDDSKCLSGFPQFSVKINPPRGFPSAPSSRAFR